MDREQLTRIGDGRFPGLVGLEILSAEHGRVTAALDVRPDHLAPHEFLHAGAVVTLADTAAGYGCLASLPQGATSFTTIELKANFLGTARDGRIACEATLVHGGRTTQIWDATVTKDDGKTIALFRCTQLLLYPPES